MAFHGYYQVCMLLLPFPYPARLAVCTGLSAPWTSPWPVLCLQPSLVQILGFFRLQLKCLVCSGAILHCAFPPFLLGSSVSPALDLATLIILGTAAPHIVLGCLWEYLTCRFQANHFWSSNLGFPQIRGPGSFRACLSNPSE